jgi:hypothetical protein
MVRNWIGTALVAITASGIIGVACGGAPASPGSPSARTETSSAAAPAATSGATISGTVVGVIASTGWTTLRVPLSVTVTGTTITATVDDGGRFTLINVPAGRIDLHFVGPGIDAHLVLDSVGANVTIEITVRVNGNNAQLENGNSGPGSGNSGPNPGPGTGTPAPDPGAARAEIEGTINAGSLTGSCAANNRSFMVGTTSVMTNASTQFRDGTCASLAAGSRVEVKGTRQGDGSILAAEVEGEDEDDDDDDDDDAREVRMTGAIATGSLAGSCTAGTLSFKISSTTIKTNSSTRFKDTACSSLRAGDKLEVRGARQTDQSVLATRVERDH